MKIISGSIFEWFETLPISRERLKKIILLTLVRSLDIPLIAITISLPIVMLIGTQNLLIFFTCIGVSILNTIFSFCLLVLFSERINRVLKINTIGSKRAHLIRMLNLVSYLGIVIGSVLLIQWVLSSVDMFFNLFVRTRYPRLIILILSMVPFPISPGYLISSFIVPHEITLPIWFNILIGIALFSVLTWLIYLKSVKDIKKSTFSKFKSDKKRLYLYTDKIQHLIKIKVKSPVLAYIRKDLIVATRDIKHFLSIVMPIVVGFIFTFTYNLTNFGGMTPFDINIGFNFIVIIGINLIISGMIVNGLLNMEESGASILSSLPIVPRERAKAKLILMALIQSVTVLAPSLMYIGRVEFLISLITAICVLPLILLLLIIMFELRVYFFGKMKYHYTIEEVLPNNRIVKWALIFLIEYLILFLLIILASIAYFLQGFTLLVSISVFILVIGFVNTMLIYKIEFPSQSVIQKR
jgi:predicted permease